MNTLPATLHAITSSNHLSALSVTVAGDTFHLLLAESSDIPVDTEVTLAFKETEVILMATAVASTANTMPATVQRIRRGEVLTEVFLSYHGATVTALVPTRSFDALGAAEGDNVWWMVQPSEISLLRETHGI